MESNDGRGEALAHYVFVVATTRPPAKRSEFGDFTLSDGLWLQQHYGDGSRMAVALLVRCSLFFSSTYRCGAVSYINWRRLLAAVTRLLSASIVLQHGFRIVLRF